MPRKACEHISTGQPPTGAQRLNRFVVPGVLLLLAEKEAHGYDLAARLAELGFVENESDTALVYRALARLSEEGFVTSRKMPGEGGPPRKVYSLTSAGFELLEEWRCVIEEKVDVLSRFLERYSEVRAEKADTA